VGTTYSLFKNRILYALHTRKQDQRSGDHKLWNVQENEYHERTFKVKETK